MVVFDVDVGKLAADEGTKMLALGAPSHSLPAFRACSLALLHTHPTKFCRPSPVTAVSFAAVTFPTKPARVRHFYATLLTHTLEPDYYSLALGPPLSSHSLFDLVMGVYLGLLCMWLPVSVALIHSNRTSQG